MKTKKEAEKAIKTASIPGKVGSKFIATTKKMATSSELEAMQLEIKKLKVELRKCIVNEITEQFPNMPTRTRNRLVNNSMALRLEF